MIHLSKALVVLTFISMFWLPKSNFVSLTGLRPEDIVGFFCVIFLPVYFANTYRKISSKFILSLLLYFLYILSISLIRSFEYAPYILVLYIKELSYLSTFFIFFYTFNKINLEKIKNFSFLLLAIIVPPIIYGLYQIITFNFTGMYGLALYGHEQSPASNGLLFLFIFIFLNIASRSIIQSQIKPIYIFISGVIVLLTGSKISVLGMLAFLLSSFLLNSKFKEKLFGVFSLSLGLFFIFYLMSTNIGSLSRYSGFLNPVATIQGRGIWWKVKWVDGIVGNITGMGLGAGHINDGKFNMTMAMDNLYLYWYVVLGFFGTILFIATLWNLYRAFPQKKMEKLFFLSILIAYLGMGMGAEIFQLSISGLLFWSMSGTLLALAKTDNWTKMTILNEKNIIKQ